MGLTLSSSGVADRRRRKTTSAANVGYHELNGNDVTDCLMTSSQQSSAKVGRAKRASRLLAVLTGRKSAAVATFPAEGDVISGNGAHCWDQQKKETEYNEGVPRRTNHSVTQFDREQNDSEVARKRRTKLPGPVGHLGPLRHWTVHSLFSRTSSVGPMLGRVTTVAAYRHTAADSEKVKPKVKVKDNAKVTKQCHQNKSSADEQSTVQLRCTSEMGEVRCSGLLCCLDEFIRRRCHHTSLTVITSYLVIRRRTLSNTSSYLVTSLTVSWCFQSVDRDLLKSGWQETSLIDDTTTIFVYALLRHRLDEYTTSVDELRTLVYVCLYL